MRNRQFDRSALRTLGARVLLVLCLPLAGCSGYSTVYPVTDGGGLRGEILVNQGIEVGSTVRLTLADGQIIKGAVQQIAPDGLVLTGAQVAGHSAPLFKFTDIARIEVDDSRNKAGAVVILTTVVGAGLWLFTRSMERMD